MEKKRVHSLDVLRTLFALMVCFIHCSPTNSSYSLIITRMAVPGFFMITGFFLESMIEKKRIVSQIKKISLILLQGWALYFVIYLLLAFKSHNVLGYLNKQISLKNLFNAVVFNKLEIAGHLWYLCALVCGLAVIGLLARFKLMKILYFTVPIELLGLLIFGKYSLLVFNTNIETFYTKNWLFVAVPFIFLGYCVKKYHKVFFEKINIPIHVILLVVCTSLAFFERMILLNIGRLATRDFYLGTILSTFLFFLLAVRFPDVGKDSVIERIGKKYSLDIYIVHQFIIVVMNRVFDAVISAVPSAGMIRYFEFFAVFLTSLFIAFMWNKFKGLISVLIKKLIKPAENN